MFNKTVSCAASCKFSRTKGYKNVLECFAYLYLKLKLNQMVNKFYQTPHLGK